LLIRMAWNALSSTEELCIFVIPEFCENDFRSTLKLAAQCPLVVLFWNYNEDLYVFGKVNIFEQLDNPIAFVYCGECLHENLPPFRLAISPNVIGLCEV